MTKQLLLKWEPVEGIPSEIYVEATHDDYEGLRFLLRGENPQNPMLRLKFESVIGYRIINESYRVRTWAALDDSICPALAVVKNSRWVQWLVYEAGGVLSEESLVHYAIYTPEDCIDVVSEYPPKAEWLTDCESSFLSK